MSQTLTFALLYVYTNSSSGLKRKILATHKKKLEGKKLQKTNVELKDKTNNLFPIQSTTFRYISYQQKRNWLYSMD